MITDSEVLQLVKDNLNQIKISEFVSEGGWPNLSHIELVIFSKQELSPHHYLVNLDILYTLDRAGCCFIPETEQQSRLSKRVEINKEKIKFTTL